MKKTTITIGLLALSLLFQNCKSTTEQEVVENSVIEKIVIKADDSLIVTNTSLPKPKEVKTTDETPVPKVEVATTPKEVVVKKEPKPKPEPVVEPKVVAETPKSNTNEPHWTIPAKYKTMINPTNKTEINDAMDIWLKECKSCHGTKGLGDGPKAEKIDISCGDFSSKEFQSFTDGELFYITTIGRKPMPSYKEKLDDNQVWMLINYMRTFKK